MVHYYVHYYATLFLIPSVSSHGPSGNKMWIFKKGMQKCSGTVNIRIEDIAIPATGEILFKPFHERWHEIFV